MPKINLATGERIVSVPMGAGQVRPGNRNEQNGYLTHAALMDADGDLTRVLCSRVKLANLCHDGALYNEHPIECPVCARRARQFLGTLWRDVPLLAVDARYSITLEHCGYPEARHVVRFCGEWVGQSQHDFEARNMRDTHIKARWSAL